METINKMWLVLIGVVVAILQGCINSIEPVCYAIIVFTMVTLLDLLTGILASKSEGKKIESSKMRRCFKKWLIYNGVFICTMVIGITLSLIASLCSATDAETSRGLLLNILKWQAYVATYIEVLSIFENLHRKYSDNIYISIIYYVLSVQIINKIPLLKEYFEAKKTNKTLLIIGAISMLSLVSCSSQIKYVPVETTRYIKTTETLRDTVIKFQLEQNEKIADTNIKDTSTLKNKYCKSSAYIQDGKLHHTLETLPNNIDIKVTTKDKATKDSIRVNVPVPYEVVKHNLIYRDRDLNWYQETCIWVTSTLFGLLGIYIILKLFKYRSNIIRTVFKLFSRK